MPEKKQVIVYLIVLTAITSAVLEGWYFLLQLLLHGDIHDSVFSLRGYLTDAAAIWVLTFLITYLLGGYLADRMTVNLVRSALLNSMSEPKRKAVFSAIAYACLLTITVSIVQVFLYVFLPDGAETGKLITSWIFFVVCSFPVALAAMYFCIMPLSAGFLQAFVKFYSRKRKRL